MKKTPQTAKKKTAPERSTRSRKAAVVVKAPWTAEEDALVQTMRNESKPWKRIADAVSALGTVRSPPTCSQRSIYLGKTRAQGWIGYRARPTDSTTITVEMPGHTSVHVHSTRTLQEITEFLQA